MKKIISMALISVMVLSMAACGNTETSGADSSTGNNSTETEQAVVTEGAGNILIAYFAVAQNSNVDAVSSASVVTIDGEAKGLTQTVADWIAEDIGGETFSIQTEKDYEGEFDALADQAQEEQDDQELPTLTTQIENLDQYDVIFVGYPIWWYDMPQVMYSFFDAYDFSGKTIIPFSVHNGSRFSGTIEEIQELEPDATVVEDGLTLRHADVEDAQGEVTSWLNELGY